MIRLRLVLRVLLVLAVVVSTQGLLLVQGTYLLRKDYVASALCVNRFNPESDCKGRCFVEDQMARHHGAGDHSDDDHHRSPALLEIALMVRAMASPGHEAPRPTERITPSVRDGDDHLPSRLASSGVFHPPRIG